MIPGAIVLCAVAGFICIVLSAAAPPRCPLWVGALLTNLALLLMVIPK